MSIGGIWDLVILNPMINLLVYLSGYLWHNFGLTIIVFTVVINLLMFPLTQKQLRASKAMQEIQAQIAEVRKKHAKDKQMAASEQMRLMKESGATYTGCLVPMLVQMPIWIVLYQAIIQVVATAPEDLLNLSNHLYVSWPGIFSQIPLHRGFLWFDLASPDLILAVLIGITMWIQQKMTTPASTDPQQKAQGQMMQVMMPLMFAFLGMNFPSGLALYWVASTTIRIVLQYYTTGWGGLIPSSASGDKRPKEIKGRTIKQKKPLTEADTGADIVVEKSPDQGEEDGQFGNKRQNRGRGNTGSSVSIRRQSGGGRSNRRKRR